MTEVDLMNYSDLLSMDPGDSKMQGDLKDLALYKATDYLKIRFNKELTEKFIKSNIKFKEISQGSPKSIDDSRYTIISFTLKKFLGNNLIKVYIDSKTNKIYNVLIEDLE